MIYLTSDLHFGHNKEFLFTPRGFANIEDHDITLVKNWNSIVTDKDEVYLLGDLMLNSNERGISFVKQLKGKIHIILGNHDTPARIKLYQSLPNVVEVVYATQIKYKGYSFYLSHYPCLTGDFDNPKHPTNILFNLFGHTHQQSNFFNDAYFMYHIGLDSHNNSPVSIEQVISDCIAKYNT